ncbi:MAG: Type-2 restriction enzyme MthTI [Parcubacteria group bacterium GW2011_GWA2_47_12]|nr:MAG: Type-2 restriction enzyme MthTI [Parcubacteria group bacterium GW2011_GWA2_47_12]
MTNILNAILNINHFRQNNLKGYATQYLNRINAVGEQLEYYVKDAFTNSFIVDQSQKESAYQRVFAYLGNQNNPPDAILLQGDAFEIKKMGTPRSILALNSSYPKDKLYRTDNRLTAECKRCDGGRWLKKDIFYVVGYVASGILKHLFLIQGLCYAADKSIYENMHANLKSQIGSIIRDAGLEAVNTVELGRVRRVDPLGITEFRLRGMWEIENPMSVFSGIYEFNKEHNFSLCAILKRDKYALYSAVDRNTIEHTENISVSDVSVRNPNNPAEEMPVKLITLHW